jgi:hypothetical protein
VERLSHAAPEDTLERVISALRALSANTRALSGKAEAASVQAAADRLERSPPDSGETGLVTSALESASGALLAKASSARAPRAQGRLEEAGRRLDEALSTLDPAADLESQRDRIVEVFRASVNLVYLSYGAAAPYPADAQQQGPDGRARAVNLTLPDRQ